MNARRVLLCLCIGSGTAVHADELRLVVHDAAGLPVPGAAVYLQGGGHGRPAATPAPVVVDQVNKEFVPRVTVIQAGTEVVFPNSDAVSHHVYSFAQPNAFELPLYKGENRPTVRFKDPGIVTLGCNIHDSMVGYIVVVDTPWYAVTDEDGVAEIADIIPGEYRATVWSTELDPSAALPAGQVRVPATATEVIVQADRRLRPMAQEATTALDWDEY